MDKNHRTVKELGKTESHQGDKGHDLIPVYCYLAFQETELLAIAHLQ